MEKYKIPLDLLSVAADLMTILGLGGIASWSLFTKDRGPFQKKVAEITAFSLKTALCLLVFILFFHLWHALFFAVVMILNQGVSNDTFYWNDSKPFGYVVGYLVTTLGLGSVFILICSMIYSWSLNPIRQLRHSFGNKSQTPE